MRRHRRLATFHDGLLDRLRLATPQPVVVGQVGEAVATLARSRMADSAVVGEQTRADLHRLLVARHFLERHARVLLEDRAVLGVSAEHFLFPLVYAGPATLALFLGQVRLGSEGGLLFGVQVAIARQYATPVAQ